MRAAEEIRSDMLTKLSGHEPGLVGLWNFDDPANPGKDSSTNGFDGKVIGQAQTVPVILPVVIMGRITDAGGRGLTNAYVEARLPNGETSRAPTDAEGNYAFTMQHSERADLFATDGERSAYRLGFQPNGERQQRLDWVLTETGVAASTSQSAAIPSSNPQSSQSLTPPVALNRVLQLDGSGSYFELAPNIYNHLKEATVEAWVRWERLDRLQYFFSYGSTNRDFFLGSWPGRPHVVFGLRDSSKGIHDAIADAIIIPGEWVHVAAVSGAAGMRLYVNGVLAATNPYAGSFFDLGNGAPHVIGSLNPLPGMQIPFFKGQVDEFRVWGVARTAEQIRENMKARLTGHEPGLVGLWNFDDPANPGKDSSTNGFDGRLIGQAQTVPVILPVVVTGRITDASGRALTNAYVEVRRADGQTSRSPTDAEGDYAFTMAPSERDDLFATDGEHSAYRLGFQPDGQRVQHLDWVLTETGVAAGSSQRESAPASQPQSNESFPTSDATNRALSLDGNGSFVELPPGCFSNLTEITVEGWVNWASFEPGSHFFEFGLTNRIRVANSRTSPDLDLVIGNNDTPSRGEASGVLLSNQWQHVAAVVTPANLRLYLNGMLVVNQ
ncbi:MAG: LamG-like jellyroll fold domain-containing protein, partial [Limisphaerales bacterium]